MTYDTRDFNAHLMATFCDYMFANGWTLGVIDIEYGEIETIINTQAAVKRLHAEELPTMRWYREGKGHWMMMNPWDEDGYFIIDHSDTPELDEATEAWLS